MEQNRAESIILGVLKRGNTDGILAENLSRALARSISYDASLRGIEESDLEAAILSAGGNTQHHVLLQKIREYQAKTRERTAVPAPAPVSNETVNRGFFLQCWHAFTRDGHLATVRTLTVSFLAKWLLKEKKYIADEEADWCARKAVEEAEEYPKEERETRSRDAYEEAVVLLVMHKFKRSMEKNREKTQHLIDEWEKDYAGYCVTHYGHEPDWSPTGFTRPVKTHAFDGMREK